MSKVFSNELKVAVLLSNKEFNEDDLFQIRSIIKKQFNWDEFIRLTGKHRITSHISQNLQQIKNEIPEGIIHTIKQNRITKTRTTLLYSQQVIRLNSIFTNNNIPCVFFKGPLLSLDLYNDIGFRDFGDIDIIIPLDFIEKANDLIITSGFKRIAPRNKLTQKQRKTNYTISHHYHYKHEKFPLDLELHWNLTNPKSFVPLKAKNLANSCEYIKVADLSIPYISSIENIVFLAAHGSVHQWYRLFWLKDFSTLISKTSNENLEKTWNLAKKLKLDYCFAQGIILSNVVYNTDVPDFILNDKRVERMVKTSIYSIGHTELKQQGLFGKLKYIKYRYTLKKDFKYRFDLIFRLRTHFTDWELVKIPDAIFFLYYLLRPFLYIYKFFLPRKH